MMDLLGADLPAAGGAAGQFAWCDGPLLGALKAGDWVLLDELNLAGQSVLEGLNALLDHRAEVFVPELGRAFRCHPGFRLFAAQNPLQVRGVGCGVCSTKSHGPYCVLSHRAAWCNSPDHLNLSVTGTLSAKIAPVHCQSPPPTEWSSSGMQLCAVAVQQP